jgi:hypothetical protein
MSTFFDNLFLSTSTSQIAEAFLKKIANGVALDHEHVVKLWNARLLTVQSHNSLVELCFKSPIDKALTATLLEQILKESPSEFLEYELCNTRTNIQKHSASGA